MLMHSQIASQAHIIIYFFMNLRKYGMMPSLVTVKLTTGTDRGARVLDSMMPVVDDAPPITTGTEGNPASHAR